MRSADISLHITIVYHVLQVKESDVELACRVLAHDFKITKEKSLHSEEIIVQPDTILPRNDDADEPRPITHTYTSPANTFFITSMAKSSIETHALSLIGKRGYGD